MKVFHYILSVYMMAIFLMPCNDMFENSTSNEVNSKTEKAHQETHDHSESTDMCSPFCICNCCGTITGMVFQWKADSFFDIIPVELTKQTPTYFSRFVSRHLGKIWQPPKINA